MQKHKKSLTLVNIFSSSSQNVRRILQFYEIHRWILTIPKEFDKSTITATVARQVFDKICIYRVKCKSLEKKIANRKLVNNISGFFTCVIYWPHKKTKNRIEPNRIKKTDKSGQAWNVELSNCIERVITREREKEKEHEKAVAASTAATTLYVVDLYRINSPSLCVCVCTICVFLFFFFFCWFFLCVVVVHIFFTVHAISSRLSSFFWGFAFCPLYPFDVFTVRVDAFFWCFFFLNAPNYVVNITGKTYTHTHKYTNERIKNSECENELQTDQQEKKEELQQQ